MPATLYAPGEDGVRASIWAPGGPEEATPEGGDWLFYDDIGEEAQLGPLNTGPGDTLYAIDVVPFGGSSVENNNSGQNWGSTTGSNLVIPLQSENSTPTVEGTEYTWEPAEPGGPAPVISTTPPAGTLPEGWDTATHFIRFSGASDDDFIGWLGGTLTLYENNDVAADGNKTVITFNSSTFIYPPAIAEYVAG